MDSKEKSKLTTTFAYKGIEVISSDFAFVNIPPQMFSVFNYNLKIDININDELNLVILDVKTQIFSKDNDHRLGGVEVRSVFEISNFSEVVKLAKDTFEINPELLKTLQIISIGTTRGIMYSTFKGSFLHGALLPLFDPTQFKTEFIPKKTTKKTKS